MRNEALVQLGWILGITGLMTAGFAANEMSHGAMAEGMGMGHRHRMDYDGVHCADMDGTMGQQQRRRSC